MRDWLAYPINEETANQIDEEVRTILENARQVGKKVLEENRPRLVHLTNKLLTEDTLEGTELEATFSEPLSEADCK